MNLNQVIARYFDVSVDYDKEWVAIRCPFHSDNNASAGLNFKASVFNCMASCRARDFTVLANDLSIDISNITEEWDEDYDWLSQVIADSTPSRPVVLRKQVEALTKFYSDRKIDPEWIEEHGGYYESRETSNDYGYLVIPYAKDFQIKRRIIGEGERFRLDKGSSKYLFGKDFASHRAIILAEGCTDYFTLWGWRKRNNKNIGIAACLGAKITKKELYALRGKIVYIIFDKDYEGYEGALKAAEILREFKATPIIIELPEEFRIDDEKLDVNFAYCNVGERFDQWLNEEINKYNSFDSYYVHSTFGANRSDGLYIQVATGLEQIDQIMNGGFASGLHGIAGKTQCGKSSLISHIADNSINAGKKVLLLSYELSKRQVWSRLISRYSPYTWEEIEKNLDDLNYNEEFVNKMSANCKVELGWTIDQIVAAMDTFDVCVLDYIQRTPYEGNDKRQGISNNGSKLGNLARDKGKIIFIVSSMPNQDSPGIMKETGDLLYMCQSVWVLTKLMDNLTSFENIKNTRGISGKTVHLEMDYAHQRVKETIPDLERIRM